MNDAKSTTSILFWSKLTNELGVVGCVLNICKVILGLIPSIIKEKKSPIDDKISK